MHLVDETVLALGGDLGLGGIRFVGPDIIVLKCHQHGIQPGVYFRRVAAGTIAGKQKLKHECRNVGSFFDAMQEIFTKHLAIENGIQLLVEWVHYDHTG